MPVENITKARTTAIADKKVDLPDAKNIIDAAGDSVSAKELAEIKKTLSPNGQWEVLPDAAKSLKSEIKTLDGLQKQAKAINAGVKKRATKLAAEEKAILKEGAVTKSFGGTVLPEKVKHAVNEMVKNGAAVYDVLESSENPVRDEHSNEWTLTGVWSPYGVQDSIPATGPMAFSYTELTPKAVEDDMKTVRDQVVLTGTKQESAVNRATSKTETWEVPTYEHKTMAGTGNIIEHYDEIGHPEVFALMTAGEGYCKWDANMSVMADGTFHCLPAMRRSDDPNFGDRILTDPSLARDKRMVFNGHIGMANGVVTDITLSGRLCKLVAEGSAKIVDPVALLEAWGFKCAPGLKVGFDAHASEIHVDGATGLIVKN